MAKTNYTFEKRQKELAKQKKQAEKLLKKQPIKTTCRQMSRAEMNSPNPQ